MHHDQAASYAKALPGCAAGSDPAHPDRCAVIVGRRWCWTEQELFAALDERARSQVERREPTRA